MIELAYFALLERVMSFGCRPLFATRAVAADAAAVRALIAAPEHLNRIVAGTPARAELVPTVSERLVAARVLHGELELLWLTWILSPRRGTTEVDLALQIESRGLVARAVLLCGGRRWLRRRLEDALDALAQRTLRAAEDVDGDARPHGRQHARRRPARRRAPAGRPRDERPQIGGPQR